MDGQEIINALNRIYEISDSIDQTGLVGVKAISKGQFTTRQAIQLELTQFLLYIANGNASFSDGEVALINLVLNLNCNSQQLAALCTSIAEPDPANSLGLAGFLSADKFINLRSGDHSTSSTDVLIQFYELMGKLMVAFDENSVSEKRVKKYINGMKSYVMKNLK